MPSTKLVKMGPVNFHAVYFDELVSNPADPFHNGRLPQDLECHCLWSYYVLASKNLKAAKDNLVYEDERSKSFTLQQARRLLESLCFQYGSTPARVVRYWDAVEQQSRALGFSSNADLPAAYKFRFN